MTKTAEIDTLSFAICVIRRLCVFVEKMKNVSCEYDRLNGLNVTLQAARGTFTLLIFHVS